MKARLSIALGVTATVAVIAALALSVRALLPPSRQPTRNTPAGPSTATVPTTPSGTATIRSGTPPPATAMPTPIPAQTIPFTVCRASETWTRPDEAEQAAEVWDTPRRREIPREMLWWDFQQSFYRYSGGNSEMFDSWPALGLWTAGDEDVTGLCEADTRNLPTGQEIELWVLLHRVLAAQRQGDVYTITVEPTAAGYQVIRLPGPQVTQAEQGTPLPKETLPPVTVRFVDTAGREIDHLPKTPPWVAIPTTREAIPVTGTVVDNAASAQVVTLQDANGTTWSIPWLDGTIVRYADGSPAQFRDITPGVSLEVTGFRSTEATTPNTLTSSYAIRSVRWTRASTSRMVKRRRCKLAG